MNDGNDGDDENDGGTRRTTGTRRTAWSDKTQFTSEDGDTFVLRAGPTHEITRTNSLDEPVFASPALANGTVYIRGVSTRSSK